MKIIRALGLVTAIYGAASWLDARSTRQRERRQERESIDKTRWESEGGATPSGPHVGEPLRGQATPSTTTGMSPGP